MVRSNPLSRLIAANVCLHACMAGIRMAAPLLALRAGYGVVAVGVLLALFSLAQVFLALPAGRFSDRHGLRRPMGLAVATSVLGAALAVAVPTFPMLCLTALLTGGATGAASISLQRHVGRAAQTVTELKQMFSWLAVGTAMSSFIGPFLAGLLIDFAGTQSGDSEGFRAAFLAMALLGLATWWWIRKIEELPALRPPAESAPTRAWDLLANPMMKRLMLINWCTSSCYDVHAFAVPVLGYERGFGASVIGAILGAYAVASIVVRVVMPWFAARIKEHVVLAAAMFVTALVFASYPFMHLPLAMGACSVVLGVALGAVQPMVMSTLHQITPPARQGEALGLRLMAINASSVTMPLLFGTMGSALGISVLFWAVGGIVAAGARTAWLLRPEPAQAQGDGRDPGNPG